MEEILKIKNFGGIKEAEIKLNEKLTIFIGPQASGKSVVAKLFYYFKKIIYSFRNETFQEFHTNAQIRFFEIFPPKTWGSDSFEIRYVFSETNEIFITRKGDVVNMKFPDIVKRGQELFLNTYNKDFFFDFGQMANEDISRYPYIYATKTFMNFYNDNNLKILDQNFIVSGRSFFSELQSIIFSLFSENKLKLEKILLEFAVLYQNVRQYDLRFGNNMLIKKNSLFDELSKNILKGKYVKKEGQDFLLHDDNREVNITFASSGQQESLPLITLLHYFMFVEYNKEPFNGTTIYIEEPETHLYPKSQKSIAEMIALVANTANVPTQIVVTTHSPYILSAFNNLIQTGEVLNNKPDKKDEINKIIPTELALNLDEVNAYYFGENGIKSIIDKENGLLSADDLDNTSTEISNEFDKLLEL